ncbi:MULTISPECIES: Gfo/Idh/MocA family protein [unclassified Synechocystis]|uniref:Gfo/Idh/MocA family protein n=1 Tax=unclassified Synechocystis TaxID=2640012 RepID=UPI00040E117F|nr:MULTISPECIES: Gfo/Idh/MocA family oxidoreductase [unclassified Synechocystis]AIE73041.1 Biliverdin reductase [Synechocystis sp. PCC 6714]MCT0254424.1 Gfo/Idh/MocA family oxidoreductase [Synechocystis sp. CS-94]
MSENFPAGATPVRVGIIGTGYAAQRRAEVFQGDRRSRLVTFWGNSEANTAKFQDTFGVTPQESWQGLVNNPEVDLVLIATINQLHGAIAEAALEAGKHVVLEYPLALSHSMGKKLQHLAQESGKLLHVEHIELLGGVHQAIRDNLDKIGEVFYARYSTIMGQDPAPQRWTYHHEQFGFPLVAALSRISRFTDLFGTVQRVDAQCRFWPQVNPDYFRACLATAYLQFDCGLKAEVIYGKGEVFHQSERTFTLHGDRGTLIFIGETGKLIQAQTEIEIPVGSRRGLFKQDTEAVLDYLTTGKPLYVDLSASLYALEVADLCAQACQNITEK